MFLLFYSTIKTHHRLDRFLSLLNRLPLSLVSSNTFPPIGQQKRPRRIVLNHALCLQSQTCTHRRCSLYMERTSQRQILSMSSSDLNLPHTWKCAAPRLSAVFLQNHRSSNAGQLYLSVRMVSFSLRMSCILETTCLPNVSCYPFLLLLFSLTFSLRFYPLHAGSVFLLLFFSLSLLARPPRNGYVFYRQSFCSYIPTDTFLSGSSDISNCWPF